MIQLKKMGYFEVTLMRDCFGYYLCRFWIENDYSEYRSRNKFKAYRGGLIKANEHFSHKLVRLEYLKNFERLLQDPLYHDRIMEILNKP